MTEAEQQRFARICEEEAETESERSGIGTYMEKRMHRILKRFLSEPDGKTEVPIGSFVADVVTENQIIEIQTGSFLPLYSKLKYYLEETDYHVTVVYPILADHFLIRMDRETGEVLRSRRSNRPGRPADLLEELYWLRGLFPHERLTIRVFLLRAEEYRYSERMRYRRAGAYEAELFPRALFDEQIYRTPADFESFLPESETFFAADFEKHLKWKPRPANRALRALCDMGLLEREMVERKYLYRKK